MMFMSTPSLGTMFASTLVALLGVVGPLVNSANSGIRIGLEFVTEDQPIDFLTFPGRDPTQFIQPWQLTDASNQFVQDGAFEGRTEDEVRGAIIAGVLDKYYDLETPDGTELNIDFVVGRVTGAQSVNVLLGQHNFGPPSAFWFGFTNPGYALGQPQGENMAAISIDRLDSLLDVEFSEFEIALNTVVNTTAHEIAHLFDLQHVCATVGAAECGPDAPVVQEPFDLMATGPSGLPETGWTTDNIFTNVMGTQSGGQSSVGLLSQNVGMRSIGDTDEDGDVDTMDITTAFMNYTGPVGMIGGRRFSEGDFDHDFDVDTRDLVTALIRFTGAFEEGQIRVVPEPAGWIVVLLALPSLFLVRLRLRR